MARHGGGLYSAPLRQGVSWRLLLGIILTLLTVQTSEGHPRELLKPEPASDPNPEISEESSLKYRMETRRLLTRKQEEGTDESDDMYDYNEDIDRSRSSEVILENMSKLIKRALKNRVMMSPEELAETMGIPRGRSEMRDNSHVPQDTRSAKMTMNDKRTSEMESKHTLRIGDEKRRNSEGGNRPIQERVDVRGSFDPIDPSTANDGRFIFPDDKQVPRPVPVCNERNFCEDSPDYPEDYINDIIQKYNGRFTLPMVDDVVSFEERINVNEEVLCQATERLIKPKKYLSLKNEWHYIVNHGNITQRVRVEECVSADKECELITNFAAEYETKCKQKYIYRELAALSNTSPKIEPEIFPIPSSCCCSVINKGKLGTRFNPGQGAVSPVQKEPERD